MCIQLCKLEDGEDRGATGGINRTKCTYDAAIAITQKLARRKAGFTKQEDHVICSAFLNVNKDSATGMTHK
jgi:hypothetical protein